MPTDPGSPTSNGNLVNLGGTRSEQKDPEHAVGSRCSTPRARCPTVETTSGDGMAIVDPESLLP